MTTLNMWCRSLKQVKTALNEKEFKQLNHKAEQLQMTNYAILKRLLKKFLDGELLLTLAPFLLINYTLIVSTLLLLA